MSQRCPDPPRLEDLPESLHDAIAVVGLACRFPGADDAEAFWANLRDGVESVRFWTPEELEASGVPPLLARDPQYVPALGALSDVAGFDASFFGINPKVATVMDPQQRLFLECCWHALEDAGVDAPRFGGPIAVYGGASLNSYLLQALGSGVDVVAAVGDLQAAIANRTDHLAPSVAYRLGLTGPAVTVQTTCSTSLVAVHLACQALLGYQTDLALAGGVRVQVPQEGGYVHETGGIFSPDGHCRPFDADAAGTLNGNGVGVVTLARLEDALEQGLPVRALIRGSAINNDGADKVGYTAPSVEGQAQVIALAQGIADVTPDEVSYVEAHGTATPLGDPIEIAALRRVFRRGGVDALASAGSATNGDSSGGDSSGSGATACALGSVKSNFGHLDTAAGVAGLIKTVLALEARQLPPTLHFQSPNPALELETSGFRVADALEPWESVGADGAPRPRRAGVSSFGIGGTNAHLVLEEAPPTLAQARGGASRPWQMLRLSARSSAALEAATERFGAYLEGRRDALAEASDEEQARALADIAYTLEAGRRPFLYRRAVLCRSLDEAVQHFQTLEPKRVFTSLREPKPRPVVFLLPGQGSQHPAMLAQLYQREPEIRRWLDRAAEILAAEGQGFGDLRERIFDGDADALRRTDLAQPALYAVEYALARQWMAWGVEPAALLGHSIGEYVAAALAGVFSFEDGLRLVAQRGRLVQALPGGAMVSVHADEDRLKALVEELRSAGHTLDLAALNRPGVGVVAGGEEAMAALRQRLEADGVVHRALHTSHAFHSAMMEPAQEAFRSAFDGLALSSPTIPFVSNVSGRWITDAEATDPGYWVRHLRATVRFSDGLEQVLEETSALLLEVGPNTHLGTLARQHPARGTDHVVLSSQRHAREEAADQEALLTTAARLWLAGVVLDGDAFYGGEERRRVALPGYPFEHRRYWLETSGVGAALGAGAGGGLPGARAADPGDWFYLPAWRRAPLPRGAAPTPDRALLLTAAAGSPSHRLGEALEQRLAAAGIAVRCQALAEGLPESSRKEIFEDLLSGEPNGGETSPQVIISLLCIDGPAAQRSAAASAGALERAFDDHFLLLQNLAATALSGDAADGAATPRLEVVTDLAQDVLGGELRWPEKAVALGPVRVGPKEIPGLVTRAVDVAWPDGEEQDAVTELAATLADEVRRPPSAPGAIVAWRGRRRWVESFEEAPLAAPDALPASASTGSSAISDEIVPNLRRGGVYLLTGGFGGMGRTFAAHLLRTVGARVVLVGRRQPTDPRYQRVVEELEAGIQPELGGEVLALRAAIGTEGAWDEVLDAVHQRFGTLHGIVHAAGVAPTSPLLFKTLAEARKALAAKVDGTLDLDVAVSRRPWAQDLDFILLCSSRAAFLAPPASVDYTAANAFLDAFALYRGAGSTTLPVLSVNWCGWRGVGMLADHTGSGSEVAGSAPGRELPVVYPFFDRRYEIPSRGAASAAADGGAVHLFELDVSPRTHWLLDDHRIGGHAVVAGTTYLELARGAAVELGVEGPVDLTDVFFLTPVRLRDDESRTLRLKMVERGDGGFDVEAASRIATDGAEHWENTVVFQLHPVPQDAPERREAPRVDLDELRRRTNEGQSVAAVEDELREDLGPRWQNVAQVFHGDGEVLGVMELGAPYHGDLEAMRLHPSLLDRAVSLGVNYLAGDVPDEFYLPMAYRRIRVLEDLPARFLAHVRRIDIGAREKETLSFAVTLLTEDGRVLVDIDHFSRKRVTDTWAQLRGMVAKEAGSAPGPAAGAPQQAAGGAAVGAGDGPGSSGDSGADEALRSALSPEEGVEAFRRLLGGLEYGRLVVSPTDLAADRAAADAVRAEDFAGSAAGPGADDGEAGDAGAAHPRPALDTAYVAPEGDLEERLAALWSAALGVAPVGRHDNYFELGGDSVLGVQIIARARSKGVEILPNQLFEYQSIAELAAVLAPADGGPVTAAADAGLPLTPRPADTPLPLALPLSLAQQRLWFLHSMAPASPAYHLSCPLRLDGHLRHRALAHSLADIVGRHEALRTHFDIRDGWPAQVVEAAPPSSTLALPVVDVSAVADPEALAAQLLEQATRRPFVLEAGAPFRALLVRVTPAAHLAIFVLHHIIADGWSIGVLVGELGALYRARTSGDDDPTAALPALPVQYGDYTLWQRQRAADGAFDADVAWWREALAGMPPRLELPTDGAAPLEAGADDAGVEDRGVTLDLRYPEPLARGLEALARSCDTTLFTVALAAFDALAARLAGQSRVVVGVPVANRDRGEIADLIGLFINTLPVPVDLGGDPSFTEVVARVRRSSLDAFSHQEAPLEKVAEAVRAAGGGREGLFSVLFGFQNAPMETLRLPDLELSTPAADRGTAMFDWTLVFYETTAALTGWIAYREQRFEAATMARFEARFGALLEAVVADPDQPLSRLPVMAAAERRQLLAAAPGAPIPSTATSESPAVLKTPLQDPSLVHLFAARAAVAPDAPALVWGAGAEGSSTTVSYRHLATLAAAGAAALRAADVGPGARVALAYEPGPEVVAALLATLAAGAAYVPLDPSQPASRLAAIIADAGVSLVLTGPGVKLAPELVSQLSAPVRTHDELVAAAGTHGGIDADPRALERSPAGPHHPAYVLFTSGSTGRPKGVVVPHGAVLALLASSAGWLDPTPADRWSVFHSLAFDFSVWELWGALAFGGAAVLVARDAALSPTLFLELLDRERVTVLSQTPGAFLRLDAADAADSANTADASTLAALRAVIFGGEALDPSRLVPWRRRRPGVALVNMYGITETTVHVTRRTLGDDDLRSAGRSPIGGALAHLSLHVVDTHPAAALEPCPAGVVGELVVGGEGLAQGYVGDPARTAARFVPDPHGDPRTPGARLYLSGDLGRRRADGDVDYLGRKDQQLKVRGYRIEAAEVEAAALTHPAVSSAVAGVVSLAGLDGVAGEPTLVLWIVAKAAEGTAPTAEGDTVPDLAALRQHMAQHVPEYMLPSRRVVLADLPLTATGKIDRRALPAPRPDGQDSDTVGAEPATGDEAATRLPEGPLETFLADLFAEVLAIPRPTATDAFFDLGGHSVAAAVLVNRIQQALDAIVHVVAIFDAPTVAELAGYLRRRHPDAVVARFGADEAAGAPRGTSGAAARAAAADEATGITEATLQRLAALVEPLPPSPSSLQKPPSPSSLQTPPSPSAPQNPPASTSTKNPPAVFVLAPPRSGTTLLRVMLAGHPRLFAPPELELLSFPDLATRRAAFDNERDRFWLEGLVRAVMEAQSLDAGEAEAHIAELESRGASSAEAYGALQSSLEAGRLLVDKTPSYALHPSILQRAEEIFDGALYIHLVRHPQGMVRSFDDAGLDEIFFRHDHGLERRPLAEALWTLSQSHILDFLGGIPAERRATVTFEDMVTAPRATMERLCAFLGLDYEPAMADPYGDGASRRMTDGPRPESRMLGDVKLLEHRGIDAAVANKWRHDPRLGPLGEPTAAMALQLGYDDLGYRDPEAAPVALAEISAPVDGRWPLAPAQERLWFLHQLAPESPAYNVPAALELTGALEVETLARALDQVVRRHGALRTVFESPGESGSAGPRQVVGEPAAVARPFPLPVVDLSALSRELADPEARRLAAREALDPFDLATGPMLRARLLRLPSATAESGTGSGTHVSTPRHGALLTVHHAVADGWSLRLLVRDFGELYAAAVAGRGPSLPELSVTYAAFASHLRQELERGSLAPALERRVKALRGTPVLELATDRPRPRVATSEGARLPLRWPAAVTKAAAAFGRRHDATPFMVTLAAYAALLARLSRQRDFAIGVPEAGRSRREVEDLVGLFVNILALRLDVGQRPSFEVLVERVRSASRAAFEDREVPLERIVEVVQPQRDPSREPLCQVALAYQNLPPGELTLPDLEVAPLDSGTAAAKFDLLLSLTEIPPAADAGSGGPGGAQEGALEGALDWRRDLFDDATAERFATQLRQLLEHALADPSAPVLELPLGSATETQQLLTYAGPPPTTWSDAQGLELSALEAVSRRVASTPSVPALDGDFGTVTYDELWRRVEARGAQLRDLAVGAGGRVAVLAAGTPEMVEGQLGTLAAGAAYVPLDPRHPVERLAAVAVAALAPVLAAGGRVALLMGGHGVSGQVKAELRDEVTRLLPDPVPFVDLDQPAPAPTSEALQALRALPRPHPQQEAYLIFTSGSTGTPKATVMTHRNLARFVAAQSPVFGIGAGRRMVQMASPAFDAAVMEVFVPLVEGSTVVLARREDLAPGPDLEQTLTRLAVDVLFVTPSVLALLDEAGLPNLAVVLCGGEACPAPLAARWSRGRRWVHVYGPTECTVITLGHALPHDSDSDAAPGTVADAVVAPPLGRGLPGVEVLLVDDALLPAPAGAVAEIGLAGAILSRGYEGRPALTASTFVPHPHPWRGGQRLYRTGDLARLAGDGTLRFHGRRDRQVQVRGVRVEPGEVEAAVVRLPGVVDAAVEGYGEGSDFRLAAWVVAEDGPQAAHRHLGAWREALRRELPEVLVPDAFVLMEALPRGTTGKVDRGALPAPVAGAGTADAVAPRTAAEERVAAVWRELLEVESIGVETPFFDLGGHSLLATRVVSRLRESTGVTLTLRDFFDAPTVAGLARRLEELEAVGDAGATGSAGDTAVIPEARRGEQDLDSLLDELGALAPTAMADGESSSGSGGGGAS